MSRFEHRVIADARIQAFRRPLPDGLVPSGGLVLSDEPPDAWLRQRRRGRPFDRFDPVAKYDNRLKGRFIYGGPLYDHFGHFMAESVHRLLPARLLGYEAPPLFLRLYRNPTFTSFETLPGFMREVLQFLSVAPHDLHLVGEDYIVEQLVAIEQGSELGLGPKPRYLEDLHDYTTPRLDALFSKEAGPSKVYVSRRGALGTFLGERYLEEQLQAEGFAIVHPETLPITAQMDIYRKAEVIVFNEGSACHGVELLGSNSLRRCYLLSRRDWLDSLDLALNPRAHTFAKSIGHYFLGSVVTSRASGRPLLPFGVTLFNVPQLLDFMRTHEIARLQHFNRTDYFDAAAIHMQRYFDAAKRQHRKLCSVRDIHFLKQRLEGMRAVYIS